MNDRPESMTMPGGAVRGRIVAAARETFLRHGFRSVTMDELADRMGMSKKTLYVHFRSKRELLDAVIECKFGELEERLAKAGAAGAADFGAHLAGFLEVVAGAVREITPAFVRDVARSGPELRERLLARRQAVLGGALERLLAAGRATGKVRADLPTELLADILLGVLNTVAVPETVIRRGIPPHEMIHGVLGVFLHGVLTPEPAPIRTSSRV